MPTLRILGPLRLQGGAVDIHIGGDKPRRLLGALALYAGEVVSADRLIDILWGVNPPRSARENLQTYVWSLRRALKSSGPGIRIQTQAPGYVLHVEPQELDWQCFAALSSAARECPASDQATAGRLLREALEMWRGPALADVADGLTPLRARIDALEEARLAALEQRIQADLALGRHRELVGEISELVSAHPLRERLRAHQMLALYRCGRQAEALAAFRELRAKLADDLGIDPTPELTRLHEAILLADLSLDTLQGGADDPQAAVAAPGGKPPRAAAPGRVPRQLPARVSGFTGRGSDLRHLDELLAGRCSMLVAVICGPPGVGKSALAVHWAHAIQRRFPDGTLCTNLRGHDPDSAPAEPADVLDVLLRGLGVPPGEIGSGEESRAALLRTTLAGRRVLMLLDDAASPRQVRPMLPGSPGCAVLVTSRGRLSGLVARDGAVPVPLAPLAAAQAIDLLRQTIGRARVDAAPVAAAQVARVCGGIPLALRIAADRAASMPLAALASQLTDERGRLEILATDDEDTAVRAAFSQSYRYLDAEAARTFRLLGLNRGPDISRTAAAALAGTSVHCVGQALGTLTGAHLVEEAAGGRLRMHGLLAVFASERAQADEPAHESEQAARRVLAWYLHTADRAARELIPGIPRPPLASPPPHCHPLRFATYEQALNWCDTERLNLVAAVRHAVAAGEHAIAVQLAGVLSAYFMLSKDHRDWIATHIAGLASAQLLGDRPAEARLLSSLGAAYGDQSQFDRAIECLEQALSIRTETGDSQGQGATLLNMGHVNWQLRRFDEGYRCLRRSLDIFTATADRYGQGMTLNNLGEACTDLGRYGEAGGYLQRARDIFREAGDRFSEAMTMTGLGEACRRQGRFGEALGLLRGSLSIRQEVGDRRGEGVTLDTIAQTLHSMGETDAALRSWRDALAIFDDLGDARADSVRGRLAALVG